MEDKDPSELTDEQLDAAIEGKELPEESPEPKEEPKEETPEVEPSQEPEPESEPEEDPAVEEPKKPSKRESLRIQQLLAKMKEQPKETETPKGLDYGTALEADPQVIAQLEADRKAVAEEAFRRGQDQSRSLQFHTRLEIDAPQVENKFPQLNKESDQFDPVIASALNQHYLQLVGYDPETDTVQNPNLRYRDFVEAQYELAEALATEKVQKSSKNIAKQAATTALRPDGSQAKRMNLNKAPQDMTDEELDAVLATLPKSAR